MFDLAVFVLVMISLVLSIYGIVVNPNSRPQAGRDAVRCFGKLSTLALMATAMALEISLVDRVWVYLLIVLAVAVFAASRFAARSSASEGGGK